MEKKFLLTLALAFAVSVALSSAYCYMQKLKLNLNSKIKVAGCMEDGEVHAFNTKWKTPYCEECICRQNGMQCCSTFGIPRGYDEETCEAIFDKKSCTYNVVKKNDHSETCPITSMIG
ncbi:beta-microseminoprotein-like isoform X1 [Ascaphus truei]|uniref:beta-microseminoprotein-like isoform X1 n=1 Tax=Ascaphus truei TaxID=8439 RepID=UPI003F5AC0C9